MNSFKLHYFVLGSLRWTSPEAQFHVITSEYQTTIEFEMASHDPVSHAAAQVLLR
jgi:hypothetical protein